MESQQRLKFYMHYYASNTKFEILKCLIKGMGMPFDFTMTKDLGYCYRNGSCPTGMLGMVQSGEVDVAVFSAPTNFLNENRLGFSFPIDISALTFATRKKQISLEMSSIFKPFSSEVWLAVLLSSFAMTLIFWALLRKRSKLSEILQNVICSLLGQSVTLRHRSEKWLMFPWLLFVMLLIRCYLSLLLSAMTVPRFYTVRDIAQLSEEVANGRYQVISILLNDMKLFSESKDRSLKIIGENTRIRPNNASNALDFIHLSKNSSTAEIAFKREFDFLSDDFYESEDYFHIALRSFPINKNFCCEEKLNRVIQRIHEAGLMEFSFHKESWVKQWNAFSSEIFSEDAVRPLTLSNLKGALAILVGGHLTAFLLLIVEMWMKRCENRLNSGNTMEESSNDGNKKVLRKRRNNPRRKETRM